MEITKDVREYSKEELELLSLDDLKVLLEEAENKQSFWHTRQLVEKTMMNSLYGALANRWFNLFNEDIAAAITGNGRYFIQKLANYVEERLQELLPQEKPYIVAGDTDSCIGSTIINTSNGKIKIEDLFHILDGKIESRGKDNFIKHINENILSASVNSKKELEFKKIKYVMKHKVKKRMFKIKCHGDEVIITEDHSVIVVRNGDILDIKPKNILPSDKIIKI